MSVTSYIEVVLRVDHDEALDDDELSDACQPMLAGLTLIEGVSTFDPETRRPVVTRAAIIDDVHTVHVRGAMP